MSEHLDSFDCHGSLQRVDLQIRSPYLKERWTPHSKLPVAEAVDLGNPWLGSCQKKLPLCKNMNVYKNDIF